MTAEMSSFAERSEALVVEHEAARAQLLRPEAI